MNRFCFRILCFLIFCWGATSLLGMVGCGTTVMGRPPKGSTEEATEDQKAAMARIRNQVNGFIVWSSSRWGNHDLFIMKTDGSEVRQLTQGEEVDWFPRFSLDGKRILFTRSKKGWVSEQDANKQQKWDLFLIGVEGGQPTLAVKDASWGTWLGKNKVLFARQNQVITKDLSSNQEEILLDSTKEVSLSGAELQNPQLSPDGAYLAITLRGAKRETGIWNLKNKQWVHTGEGCQINWFPQGDRILWVNPSGNGGSEVLSVPVKEGKPLKAFSFEEMRFMDIPGQRSHEYFPQLDHRGQWLVWAATRRGHDHDIADYEIYIWKVGAPAAEATRLTFHSANDRWPDIFIPTP